MIKVQNGIATREPVPSFLVGLLPESLADLSWTAPELGVQDCAWLPEVVTTPEYNADTHKLGAEVLTVDAAAKVVNVTYEVVPLTSDELTALRKAKVPHMVTMRQARLALLESGLLSRVAGIIDAMPSPKKEAAQIEWEYSQTVERHRELVAVLAPALDLDDAATDELFIKAAKL